MTEIDLGKDPVPTALDRRPLRGRGATVQAARMLHELAGARDLYRSMLCWPPRWIHPAPAHGRRGPADRHGRRHRFIRPADAPGAPGRPARPEPARARLSPCGRVAGGLAGRDGAGAGHPSARRAASTPASAPASSSARGMMQLTCRQRRRASPSARASGPLPGGIRCSTTRRLQHAPGLQLPGRPRRSRISTAPTSWPPPPITPAPAAPVPVDGRLRRPAVLGLGRRGRLHRVHPDRRDQHATTSCGCWRTSRSTAPA